MKGTPAVYLGRVVSKDNFRTFVYAPDGSQELIESWKEYENHMASGLWFATKDEALNQQSLKKTKRTKKLVKPKAEERALELNENKEPETYLCDENSEHLMFDSENKDDFLPKAED